MIKLNLLPQYVIEVRRIRTVVIAFLVLLAVEGGIVYKAYLDLNAQIAWFKQDQQYFTARTAEIKAAKAEAEGIKGKTGVYAPYIAFFTRAAIVQYNDGVAKSLEDVSLDITGGKAWFNNFSLKKTGEVTINGQIDGLMNFLDYYFKMKDKNYTITAAALPAASPSKPTMTQQVPIAMAGKVKNAIPAEPTPTGEKPVPPSDLDKSTTAAAAPAAPAGGGKLGSAGAAGGGGRPGGAGGR